LPTLIAEPYGHGRRSGRGFVRSAPSPCGDQCVLSARLAQLEFLLGAGPVQVAAARGVPLLLISWPLLATPLRLLLDVLLGNSGSVIPLPVLIIDADLLIAATAELGGGSSGPAMSLLRPPM